MSNSFLVRIPAIKKSIIVTYLLNSKDHFLCNFNPLCMLPCLGYSDFHY